MQRDVDRLDDILTAAADVMEFHGGLTRDRFETEKATKGKFRDAATNPCH